MTNKQKKKEKELHKLQNKLAKYQVEIIPVLCSAPFVSVVISGKDRRVKWCEQEDLLDVAIAVAQEELSNLQDTDQDY